MKVDPKALIIPEDKQAAFLRVDRLERENRYLRRLLKAWLREAGDIGDTYYSLDSSWAYRGTEALFKREEKK